MSDTESFAFDIPLEVSPDDLLIMALGDKRFARYGDGEWLLWDDFVKQYWVTTSESEEIDN